MKPYLTIIAAIFLSFAGYAQEQDFADEYRNFKEEALAEFSRFRSAANREYAQFLKQAWKEMEALQAVPYPHHDPPVLPQYDPDDDIPGPYIPDDIPYNVPPLPSVPDDELPTGDMLSVDFFGQRCGIRIGTDVRIRLAGVSGEDLSKAWTELSDGRCDAAILDCLRLREELRLCDWGYYQLVSKTACAYTGNADENLKTVIQAYILAQSGYKMRIARSDDRLYLLIASDIQIYECYSAEMADNLKYYFLDKTYPGGEFSVCDAPYPDERIFSMYIDEMPLLPETETVCISMQSARYPALEMWFCPNKNLTDFLSTYPCCPWDVYASAPLSNKAREIMYPVFKENISAGSEPEAAEMILNFVQTAFEYKTDDEQFGYEKPMFPDETLNYPYSDCEDRAILFATLARDLLGLDVVLMHYPNHIAAAVCFNSDVSGDSVMHKGRKYIVCDPTFIGAPVGVTMPGMNNAEAEIIELK